MRVALSGRSAFTGGEEADSFFHEPRHLGLQISNCGSTDLVFGAPMEQHAVQVRRTARGPSGDRMEADQERGRMRSLRPFEPSSALPET